MVNEPASCARQYAKNPGNTTTVAFIDDTDNTNDIAVVLAQLETAVAALNHHQQAATEARTARDHLIRTAFATGHIPIRALATITGITPERISLLLGRPHGRRGRPRRR